MAGNKGNDRIMDRGLQQAMYRYLPGRWVDFYIKSSRESYSAHVEHWNSEKIDNVNVERIKREVWHRLASHNGCTSGFAPLNDSTSWSVLKPKTEDMNPAIMASVSPLVFYCSDPSCRKIATFRSSEAFLSDYNRNRYCSYCRAQGKYSRLTQVRLIYYCKCGFGEAVEVPKIPGCNCNKPLRQKSTYVVECTKCHRTAEYQSYCKGCGSPVFPKNALDNAQLYAHNFSLVDLVDQEQETYISTNTDGRFMALAYWLGLLGRERFQSAIRYKLQGNNCKSMDEKIAEQVAILRQDPMFAAFTDDMLKLVAATSLQASDPQADINKAISETRNLLSPPNDDAPIIWTNALKVLEYDTVLYSPTICTLDDAAELAYGMREIYDKSQYTDAVRKAKFSMVQACSNVPFITAVYGYTRKNNKVGFGKQESILCAFTPEKNTKSNIYANSQRTEGVLFELDRREVLRWLQRNGIVTQSEYNDNMTEAEVKAWFMRSCDETAISVFGEIEDTGKEERFYWVFRLLHSISHVLIRKAAEICGLDKSSLAEYIFSSIPAVFVYCSNSQGFSLGALFSAMQTKLDYWINSAMEEVQQCVFDPICKNEDGACAGCLYLNDISCHYMNHNLNRKLLTGYVSQDGKRIYGYWER